MVQPITITQNNYGYQIPFTLLDGSGNPVNLTSATLVLKVQSAQDSTDTLITLGGSISIDSATAGTCHYTVANGDFPNPGTFLGEIVVTLSAGPVSFSGIQIVVQPTLPKTIN
jgi:hypothetical protein